MMRSSLIVLAIAVLLCGCAHTVQPPPFVCPDVPRIGDTQTLKEYTLHLIDQYNACKAGKGQ